MSRKEIATIFDKSWQSACCHPKCIIALTKIYNKTPFDEFVSSFMQILLTIFQMPIHKKNPYAEKSLSLAANFTAKLVNQAAAEITDAKIEELETHPFLENIFKEVLKYSEVDIPSVRYYSCQFVTLVLKHTGDNVHLDADICDTIQNAMLLRIADCLTIVRVQAVSALLRLQDPTINDCPVIQAYILHLNDPSARVRRHVIEQIAPVVSAIPKIVERVRDVDALVRMAVYHKCAIIGPGIFKIMDRQFIFKCGFEEENGVAKKAFLGVLLPKWITWYDGNFLKFITAIKFDADEVDIKNWELLSKNIMIEVLKGYPINDIIECLPLNENKLIPLDKLSCECTLYWYILFDLFKKNSDLEDFVEQIIPELTHFSNYIEQFIKDKDKNSLEDWKYLESQCILNYLLNMVKQFDFSDEVGKINLQRVIVYSLIHHKAKFDNVYTLVETLSEVITEPSQLNTTICQIISEIRQPSIEFISPENEFLIASLKVKLNIAIDDMEEAVKKSNFLLAEEKKLEIGVIEGKLNDINQGTTKKRVIRDDPDTVCRYLNIMIALLQLPCITMMDASLQMFKDEFVLPLADCGNSEIFWRMHKCIGLFCLLEEDLATENFKTICTPLIMYRMLPNYNKQVLLTSIGLFSDLLRMYGSQILGDINFTSIVSSKRNVRRLYQQNDTSEFDLHDLNLVSCEEIIDIIVDMLDDDLQEVRECAGNSLSKLIIAGLLNSPTLISRIIVMWFNPNTEKNDPGLQQIFGVCLQVYTETIPGSEEVLEKAVIPTLNTIANAPPTSPLSEISVDGLVKFLCAITSINKNNQIVNTHKNIAISLCSQLAKKPENKCTNYWTKMLLNLNIPNEDSAFITEMVKEVELLLESVQSKHPRKDLSKYLANLKARLDGIKSRNVNLDCIAEETNNDSKSPGSCPKIIVQQTVILKNGQNNENNNLIVENNEEINESEEVSCSNGEEQEEIENHLEGAALNGVQIDNQLLVESSDSGREDRNESDSEVSEEEHNLKETKIAKENIDNSKEKAMDKGNSSKSYCISDSSMEENEKRNHRRKKLRLDNNSISPTDIPIKGGTRTKVHKEKEIKTVIDARMNLPTVEAVRRSKRIACQSSSHGLISSDLVKNQARNNEANKTITGSLSCRESVSSKSDNTKNKKRCTNESSSDTISTSSNRTLRNLSESDSVSKKSLRNKKRVNYDNPTVKESISNNNVNQRKIPVVTSPGVSTRSKKSDLSKSTEISMGCRKRVSRPRNTQIVETDSSTTEKEETTNINNKRETSKKSMRKGKKTKIDLNSSQNSSNSSPARRFTRSNSTISDKSHNRSLPLKRKKGNKTGNCSMISSKSEETMLHTFLQGDEFVCERINEYIELSSDSDTYDWK